MTGPFTWIQVQFQGGTEEEIDAAIQAVRTFAVKEAGRRKIRVSTHIEQEEK